MRWTVFLSLCGAALLGLGGCGSKSQDLTSWEAVSPACKEQLGQFQFGPATLVTEVDGDCEEFVYVPLETAPTYLAGEQYIGLHSGPNYTTTPVANPMWAEPHPKEKLLTAWERRLEWQWASEQHLDAERGEQAVSDVELIFDPLYRFGCHRPPGAERVQCSLTVAFEYQMEMLEDTTRNWSVGGVYKGVGGGYQGSHSSTQVTSRWMADTYPATVDLNHGHDADHKWFVAEFHHRRWILVRPVERCEAYTRSWLFFTMQRTYCRVTGYEKEAVQAIQFRSMHAMQLQYLPELLRNQNPVAAVDQSTFGEIERLNRVQIRQSTPPSPEWPEVIRCTPDNRICDRSRNLRLRVAETTEWKHGWTANAGGGNEKVWNVKAGFGSTYQTRVTVSRTSSHHLRVEIIPKPGEVAQLFYREAHLADNGVSVGFVYLPPEELWGN